MSAFACTNDIDPPPPIKILVGLEESSCRLALPPPPDAGPAVDAGPSDTGPPSCGDFPRFCEAWVGIRVVDGDVPISQLCERLAGAESSGSLCDIHDIDVRLPDKIPPRSFSVEIAVWDADAASITTAPDGSTVVNHCPSIKYDVTGAPLLTPDSPAPAFARRKNHDFGSGQDIEIELVCNDPKQLSDEMCLPVIAEAEIFDFATMAAIEFEEAQNEIEVVMGSPTQDKDGNWFIEGTIPMRLSDTVSGFGPIFKSDDLQPRFEPMKDDACVLVRRKDEAQPATMVRCIVVEQEGDLYIDGYTLREETLTQLLLSLDPMGVPSVPNQGIVIGRIVNEANLPVAGANVVIQHMNPTSPIIAYPNDDLSQANLTSTGAQGYFIVQYLPFNAFWAAIGPDGLATDRTIVKAGELSRRVTLMKLVLHPPEE